MQAAARPDYSDNQGTCQARESAPFSGLQSHVHVSQSGPRGYTGLTGRDQASLYPAIWKQSRCSPRDHSSWVNNMKATAYRFLFPDPPRDFPARRLWRALFRTVHILGGGVLVGAYLFHQEPATIHLWLMVTALSGLLLLATDLHASCAILFEVRGLSMVVKLVLLGIVSSVPGWEVAVLILILSIGSVSSHLSRRVRHRLWWKLPGLGRDQRRG
jgi:hypothetical protein